MKPGGWWTSWEPALWLITLPMLGWQKSRRWVLADRHPYVFAVVHDPLLPFCVSQHASKSDPAVLNHPAIRRFLESPSRSSSPLNQGSETPSLGQSESESLSQQGDEPEKDGVSREDCGRQEGRPGRNTGRVSWNHRVEFFFLSSFRSCNKIPLWCCRTHLVCRRLSELSTKWCITRPVLRPPDSMQRRQS